MYAAVEQPLSVSYTLLEGDSSKSACHCAGAARHWQLGLGATTKQNTCEASHLHIQESNIRLYWQFDETRSKNQLGAGKVIGVSIGAILNFFPYGGMKLDISISATSTRPTWQYPNKIYLLSCQKVEWSILLKLDYWEVDTKNLQIQMKSWSGSGSICLFS